MKNAIFGSVALAVVLLPLALGNNDDSFNYRYGDTSTRTPRDYGLEDWDRVTCDDPGECRGWPYGYEHAPGWDLNTNECEWCPLEGGNSCGQHRQSPIDLYRDRAIAGNPNEKECPDWHWMQYRNGTCDWDDMSDQFSIDRHALVITTPINRDGEVDCVVGGTRRFPRLDYSKGFPDWWWLSHTEISVPSEHFQHGEQYDAEVVLSHFYSIDHYKNQIGKVAIFMNAYDDVPSWPFLDKLICKWRAVEQEIRDDCGLDPAPPYEGCRLFGSQTHGPSSSPTMNPSNFYPTVPPTSEPTYEPTNEPTREPSVSPSVGPTPAPTPAPTPVPTPQPTPGPTPAPTPGPTAPPTPGPTPAPTPVPTPQPTPGPTPVPTTAAPSPRPTPATPAPPSAPTSATPETTASPTPQPTPGPTPQPTNPPTPGPTPQPTNPPTASPTPGPTSQPTPGPTPQPTPQPTPGPTNPPTPGPTPQPTPPPTPGPTPQPTPPPTPGPTPQPTPRPTPSPTSSPSIVPTALQIPEWIDCEAWEDAGANTFRMCKENSCCETPRSSTDFCHETYDLFGDLMPSACYHCCDEPKSVGEPAPVHPDIPQSIQCSEVDNPFRICKPDGCCEAERSATNYCEDIYEDYEEHIDSICWYCCSEPKIVGPPLTRKLGLRGSETAQETSKNIASREEMTSIPEGARVVEVDGRRLILRKENFEEDDDDEQEYFDALYAANRQNRRLSGTEHSVDYDDVFYWPYEWLVEVGTEYYFRYEGTQTVPPCKDKAHWRVMKDPIRVHPRQIRELERLLADRIAPRNAEFNSCQAETAGRPRPGSNAVDVNRPLQEFHTLHRKVFCECQDWPSKFEGDRDWCRGWRDDDPYDRLYRNPYNFDSDVQFTIPTRK